MLSQREHFLASTATDSTNSRSEARKVSQGKMSLQERFAGEQEEGRSQPCRKDGPDDTQEA